ncbi:MULTISPECIES: type VII secretion protein EccE [Streptomyces]|uniref:type VII secretion protein EccE n=1 Tax=Streptomyces TaxID=1883 RepID=UPI00374DFDA5
MPPGRTGPRPGPRPWAPRDRAWATTEDPRGRTPGQRGPDRPRPSRRRSWTPRPWPRGGGPVGARKCVARAAHRLASRLTGAGFRTTVLDEKELIAALATSVCANPPVTAEAGRAGSRERRTEESGRGWRCDNRRHTTHWIRAGPEPVGAAGRRCPGSSPGSRPFPRPPPPSASRRRTRRDRRCTCPGVCG